MNFVESIENYNNIKHIQIITKQTLELRIESTVQCIE